MTAPVLVFVALLLGVQGRSELPSLIFPADENAWVIRIVSSGGFAGQGAGNVTASSAGQVLCTLVATCPDRLVPETNRVFSQLVSTLGHAEPRGGRGVLSPGGCFDCVTTNMTVQWRDAEGEHVVRYTWDLSTARTIPDAALRLHAALIDLTSPRSR